ncbi:MAG: uracil-DNA glycosylase family protein [Phycisphaerales bacterium]|nr:uracil-DNA glycosylase family protein [Phycisphaerales bacterium]
MDAHDDGQLKRLVVQSAETDRLLGGWTARGPQGWSGGWGVRLGAGASQPASGLGEVNGIEGSAMRPVAQSPGEPPERPIDKPGSIVETKPPARPASDARSMFDDGSADGRPADHGSVDGNSMDDPPMLSPEFPSPRGPATARSREESQKRLDELRARYEHDAPHQHFVTHFNNIVFGEGDPCARLLFCGEAPGEEEDKTGRPFVGRAGQLLEKMITAMGLSREEVYICNVLKTRPPNNATPTLEESALCAPYLFEQIDIVAPEAIVTLGLPATKTVLGVSDSMGRLRAHWHTFKTPSGRSIPVMPTYHPAYLLRSYTPENRQKVWSDLQLVMKRLGLRGA